LALAQAPHDPWTEMKVRNTLGLIAVARADLSLARHHVGAYLDMARSLGSLDEELTATNNLATVLTLLGAYPEARAHFEHIRSVAVETGDRFMEATALVNLAWVAASGGEWAEARELAARGIARKRAIGQRDAVAEALVWLGHAQTGLQDPVAAIAAYQEALEIREELRQTALAMAARAGLARAQLAAGNGDAAWTLAMEVVRYLDDGGTLEGDWEPYRTHLACAEILAARGDQNADRVLDRTHRALLASADRVQDEDDRRRYLEQVPWHRRILDLARDAADR
jgi:ATP/maltotriose-dependent transcriptional regulator MalT